MKKFNLKEAMAGKPVLTRNGKKVTNITYFAVDDSDLPCVYGLVDGYVESWHIKGQEVLGAKNDLDLFMAFEKTSVWINVYEYPDGGIIIDGWHNSIEKAKNRECGGNRYIKTIEITNEP